MSCLWWEGCYLPKEISGLISQTVEITVRRCCLRFLSTTVAIYHSEVRRQPWICFTEICFFAITALAVVEKIPRMLSLKFRIWKFSLFETLHKRPERAKCTPVRLV